MADSTNELKQVLFSTLPRCIRWRIQLGLLYDAPASFFSVESDSHILKEKTSNSLSISHSENRIDRSNEDRDIDPFGDLSLELIHRTNNTFDGMNNTSSSSNYPPRPLFSSTDQIHDRVTQDSDVSVGYQSTYRKYCKILQSINQTKVMQQRTRFKYLSDKHFWKSSPLAIIEDSESKSSNGSSVLIPCTSIPMNTNYTPTYKNKFDDDFLNPLHSQFTSENMNIISSSSTTSTTKAMNDNYYAKKNIGKTTPTTNPVNIGIPNDPLSIMAKIQEKETECEKQRQLSQRKERVMNSRGKTLYSSTNEKSTSHNQSPILSTSTRNINEAQHTESRWSEFYSSRDIIDIIDKDLNRLPIDHHSVSFWRKVINKQPKQHNNTVLPPFNIDDTLAKQSKEERSKILSQILFVYAKEHPALGYKQGMHEILSFILLSIEFDLLQKRFVNYEVTSDDDDDVDKKIDVDPLKQSYKPQVDINTKIDDCKLSEQLLDPVKVMEDAYIIFETVMTHLAPAYGVATDTNNITLPLTHNESFSMDRLGESVCKKLRQLDENLYNYICNLHIPPQIYCMRWIRLMFSREVIGWKNVMMLWDNFFELNSVQEQSKLNSSTSVSSSLINILETTAVCMIFLIKDKLMPSIMFSNNWSDDTNSNESIQILMNYPPSNDSALLVRLIKQSLSCQRKYENSETILDESIIYEKHFIPHSSSFQPNDTNIINRSYEHNSSFLPHGSRSKAWETVSQGLHVMKGAWDSLDHKLQSINNSFSGNVSLTSRGSTVIDNVHDVSTENTDKFSRMEDNYSNLKSSNYDFALPQVTRISDAFSNKSNTSTQRGTDDEMIFIIDKLESSVSKLKAYLCEKHVPDDIRSALLDVEYVKDELVKFSSK